MLLLAYAILIGLFLVYTLYRYRILVGKYSALTDEVCKCYAEIERIKTLNKLKVDCNGDPIIYEKPNEPNI